MPTTRSVWQLKREGRRFPWLDRDDLHVDVAIVGGGITGVTAALLLKAAGKKVALLEAQTLGSGVTCGTTAHVTEALDTRYRELERKFGREGARLARESSRAAIEKIADLVRTFAIPCDFERVPGYLFSERAGELPELSEEAEAARRAGAAVSLVELDLPFPTTAALRFEDQAAFNPLAYLDALAPRIPGDGSHVFQSSRVVAIEEAEPCRLRFEHGPLLTAERVILATHAPLTRFVLQTKLAHYRSYVVAGPAARVVDGLYWDTAEPYHYVRRCTVDGQVYLVVGGEDHKTGMEDPEAAFLRLQEYAARFGVEVRERWSAQVIEPVDGLPFIGRNGFSDRVFVATGFSGNGITFGTLSAMLLSDSVLGRKNPYAELYRATRIKPLASASSFVGENVDFPLHLVGDRIRAPEARSVDEVGPGEGKIVRVRGQRLAVYRGPDGELSALSPVCTHLGCHVRFNTAEKSWDCPCHGSRFRTDGSVLNGPATKALERKSLPEPRRSPFGPRPARRKPSNRPPA